MGNNKNNKKNKKKQKYMAFPPFLYCCCLKWKEMRWGGGGWRVDKLYLLSKAFYKLEIN